MKNEIDWAINQTENIVESPVHPLETVDFPTVTLCPTSTNPDRWGFAIKLFDFLKIKCFKDRGE